MGVRDIIEKQKQQFFVARDSDKRELQRLSLIKENERLEKERVEVAEIRRLQNEIKVSNQAIHQDMTSGSRGIAQRLTKGFSDFGEVVKKFDKPEVSKSPFHVDADKIKLQEVNESPFRRNR